MKIIKRNGTEVAFDSNKIKLAIIKANNTVDTQYKLNDTDIDDIIDNIVSECEELNRTVNVEDIQDMVETEIMLYGGYEVAKNYITYRYSRELLRKKNTTDERILSIVDFKNEDIKQENSNKNPIINSTQRDYIAGETSRDITDRLLLPADIVKAHKDGLIHFHDSDYFIQHIHNCDLINLEDILQNGTVISNTLIEKPHSFSTACNITTQVVAQVASNQYGGQTFTLTHLAPFVDISRQHIIKNLHDELDENNLSISDEKFNNIVEKRVRKEVEKGVQIIQYQILTLLTTNGQTPFVTEFMYLNETDNKQTRDDLAIIIEETLKQRMLGVKNSDGVWITPAFPKLIYVLEDNNITEDSEYYYLTELAAKCTAKRMVPDYISEKIMIQNKIDKNGEGHCYPSMGLVA